MPHHATVMEEIAQLPILVPATLPTGLVPYAKHLFATGTVSTMALVDSLTLVTVLLATMERSVVIFFFTYFVYSTLMKLVKQKQRPNISMH